MKDSIATFVVFTISGLFSIFNTSTGVKNINFKPESNLIDSLNKRIDTLELENNKSIDSIKSNNSKLNKSVNQKLKEIDSLRFESENHEYPIIYNIQK